MDLKQAVEVATGQRLIGDWFNLMTTWMIGRTLLWRRRGSNGWRPVVAVCVLYGQLHNYLLRHRIGNSKEISIKKTG